MEIANLRFRFQPRNVGFRHIGNQHHSNIAFPFLHTWRNIIQFPSYVIRIIQIRNNADN
jgi:hypothetical protein